MSGIVAIIHKDRSDVDKKLLSKLTNYMTFRGPDAQNVCSIGHVGFGHTLLKITFESEHEKQPYSLDQQLWITADARIDDRQNLISQLRSLGKQLSEDIPDVELILHSYQQWGEDCLDHLIGDFAFIIWDALQQKLFCAHDHFGVVPLLYADVEDYLIISNTLDCIRQHPMVGAQLNKQAVGDFLLFNLNINPATTTFKNIDRLPPSHCMSWQNNSLQIRQYWHLPQNQKYKYHICGKTYIDRFQHLLYQAISDRLRTNKAATHLSGGMDSTAIAAIACDILRKRNTNFDFRSYTVVHEQLIQEQEGEYAKIVADHLQIPNRQIVADSYIRRVPDIDPKYALPEPYFIPQLIAEIDKSRYIAEHSRMYFAGFGGDPLFYCPPNYRHKVLLSKQIVHLPQTLFLLWFCYSFWPKFQIKNPFVKTTPQLKAPRVLHWFSPEFDECYQTQTRYLEIQKILANKGHGLPSMFLSPLWRSILYFSDAAAHRFPLKAHFPFFDLRLWKFFAATPLPWFRDKLLLREATKAKLPPKIYQRPKTLLSGYPHYNWLRKEGLQGWMKDLLNHSTMEKYIDAKEVIQSVQSSDFSPLVCNQVFTTLYFAYWLQTRK